MSDTLFNIEPTNPKWRELADLHGISCFYYDDLGYLPPTYVAEIDWFGGVEKARGETEREATIALIHRLKLKGWQGVSI